MMKSLSGRNIFFGRPGVLASVWILGLLYAAAFLAELIAPYSFSSEARALSYAPPSKIHLVHEGRLRWPFVYDVQSAFDTNHRRYYVEDRSRPVSLEVFGRGEPYRLLGLLPGDRHLLTVREPSRFLLLGADARGRDIFSRIVHGARISLTIGLAGVAISFLIGLLVGGAAGYFGGWIDSALMRLCEMVMMVPGFYLLLALRAAVPDNFTSVQVYGAIVIILSFISWAGLARVIRGMSLSLRERDYVMAARSMGVSDLRIIVTHILPHTLSYSLAAVMLSIPGYILGESALSLIGLGIQDPYASWGNMLSEAMSLVKVTFAPWLLWPAVFICVTVACFNIIGDALRDVLDPDKTAGESA